MTEEEIVTYRKRLLELRKVLQGDASNLADQALRRETGPHLPMHMADLGTDTFDQEFALGLLQNEEAEIREIDEALERISDGSFGHCESCSHPIPASRLEAIPYARLCMQCKQKEEEEARHR
ncbi:MAG: TraR/DksA C4-type zinc finger protein [Planctomycetes bacterium]|nr:TraR/DksA C4-type zinc finger protein [Planctomycetota bacterium]